MACVGSPCVESMALKASGWWSVPHGANPKLPPKGKETQMKRLRKPRGRYVTMPVLLEGDHWTCTQTDCAEGSAWLANCENGLGSYNCTEEPCRCPK